MWKIEGPLAHQLTTFEYWSDTSTSTLRGRLKARKVRVSQTEELTATFWNYDNFGNPLRVVVSRLPLKEGSESEEQWLFSYENGRPVAITDPKGETWIYRYTPAGELAQVEAPQGNLTKYGYGPSGLLASVGRYPMPLASTDVLDEVTYARADGRGNVTEIQYKMENTIERKASYGYDTRNRPAWEGLWSSGGMFQITTRCMDMTTLGGWRR